MNVLLALAVTCLPQDPAAPSPQQALVRIDQDLTITAGDYAGYLLTMAGATQLEDLILDRLMARELDTLDLSQVGAATRASLAAPDDHVRKDLEQHLGLPPGGFDGPLPTPFADAGWTKTALLARQSVLTWRELRITALVQAARQPTETALRTLFDQCYGVDGMRVQVRHVFVSLHALRRRMLEPGAPEPTAEQLAQRGRALLAAAQRELDAGAAFGDVVAKYSDDYAARQAAAVPAQRDDAGRIADYNYQHFGPEFAAAVRALEPGQVSPPVSTSHGWHLIKLDQRTVTSFADVQAELLTALRDAPPTLAEPRALRQRLLTQYRVRETLAALHGTSR